MATKKTTMSNSVNMFAGAKGPAIPNLMQNIINNYLWECLHNILQHTYSKEDFRSEMKHRALEIEHKLSDVPTKHQPAFMRILLLEYICVESKES